MQGGSGEEAVYSAPIDKTRVLEIKPLRSLKPIFPEPNEAAPFVCTSPNGPFPTNYTPFYPVHFPPHATAAAVTDRTPIPSFRTPSTQQITNGDTEESPVVDGKRKNRSGSSQRRRIVRKFKSGSFVIPITSFQQEIGNKEMVDYVLMTFDGLRRRFSQLEDAKEAPGALIKRADLKAGSLLMSRGLRTNMKKVIGAVPGVEIGDIFYFRIEMCMVGLHLQSMGGIDYLSMRSDGEEEPTAISIVSSGYYDNDAEDKDVLIYSGQGGLLSRGKQASDQKLERGNLALDRSMHRSNEIRVIRAMPDAVNPHTKVYVYDGLYIIQQSWMEKGKSGTNSFKYKLVRVPGQPEAFGVWKSIQRWKEDVSSRPGLLVPDLSSGAESISVSLVNEVDSVKGPPHFNYVPTLKPSQLVNSPPYECACRGGCKPGDLNCSCTRTNGGDFPYTANGVLVTRRPLIYECGPTCLCGPKCKNRVSQGELKIRLEVFKTLNKGWGLRTCNPIRAGTFICEYAGEILDEDSFRRKGHENDEYIFNTTRVYQKFKWNYESGFVDDESPPSDDSFSQEEYNIPSPLIISAKENGNVARFMNHGCYPNVFWQPVTYGSSAGSYVHIGFYAMRHIPPMTELTYDYGMVVAGEGGRATRATALRRRRCFCGYDKCRGYCED